MPTAVQKCSDCAVFTANNDDAALQKPTCDKTSGIRNGRRQADKMPCWKMNSLQFAFEPFALGIALRGGAFLRDLLEQLRLNSSSLS